MKTEAVSQPSTSKEVPRTANKSAHRSLAILKMTKVASPIVTSAQSIATAMTNNPEFPSARNDKKAALVALLEQLALGGAVVAAERRWASQRWAPKR